MKHFIFILSLFIGLSVKAQYNPTLGNVSNNATGYSQQTPSDMRSQYFDVSFQKYRDFASRTEAVTYLTLTKYRANGSPIFIHEGGSLVNAVWIGGQRRIYIFKDSTDLNSLVPWSEVTSVNGQKGDVVIGNSDSLKHLPVDTSASPRNNYLLTFDSTLHKWKLTAPSSSYTAGTGILISGNTISGDNTTSLWNANTFRGRSISTTAPNVGNIYKWNGVSWVPSPDLSALDTAYTNGDTLFLIANAGADTIPVIIPNIYTTDGALTTDRIVTMRDNSLDIVGDTLSSIHLENQNSVNSDERNALDINRGISRIYASKGHYSQLEVYPDSLKLIYNNNATGRKYIKLDTTAITIVDNISSFGQKYGADYSVNGKANPRWLPDIAAVRNTIHDSSGNYIKPSDTASMLTPYLRKGDTTAMLSPYIKDAGYGIIKVGKALKADTTTLFPAVRASIPGASIPSWKSTVYVNDTTTSLLVFDTTLTPTVGGTVEKDWLKFQPLDKKTGVKAGVPFLISTASTSYGSWRNDEVAYMGYNMNATGGAVIAGKAAIGIGMESHYQPFVGSDSTYEMHFKYISAAGTQYRMGSYTADGGNGNIDFFHTLSTFRINAPSTGLQYFGLSGDGASGSTNTTFSNSAGNFNIVQNSDKSVIFNNTYSATNRSLQISSSWDNVQLPGVFFDNSSATYSTIPILGAGAYITGGTFSGSFAQILKSPTVGLIVSAGSGGSSYDFALSGRAGASILLIPANTVTASFVGNVGIKTETPVQALQVHGQIKIDTTTNGTAGTDSVLVQSGGVVKRISPTYYSAGSATTIYTGDGSLSGNRTVTLSTNYLNFSGTSAIGIPAGTIAQRPTGAVGYLRINIDSSNIPEYYNGSRYSALADREYVINKIATQTASGTYTPTFTNTTNITSSSLTQASYIRTGNIVHVSIGGTLNATLTSTASTLTFTLPITTATTAQSYVGDASLAYNAGALGTYGGLISIASGTTGTLSFTPTVAVAGSINFNVQFDYIL